MVSKTGIIDHHFQGHLAISSHDLQKICSTSLLYTDLGRPVGIRRPNVLLC